jgi:hypothetical protein
MDLHQIGTGLGIQVGVDSGNYAQQEQQKQSSSTSSSTPSSSVSPSTRRHPQHFQHHQLYNLLPTQPNGSYSPTTSSWPRSRDLLHHQQQHYQPQQSNIKLEIMGKHLDTGNGSKNVDDSMPSTSDFVKKLYKFVPVSFFLHLFSSNIDFVSFLYTGFLYVRVGCWKIRHFKMSYLGDRWVIVLL